MVAADHHASFTRLAGGPLRGRGSADVVQVNGGVARRVHVTEGAVRLLHQDGDLGMSCAPCRTESEKRDKAKKAETDCFSSGACVLHTLFSNPGSREMLLIVG